MQQSGKHLVIIGGNAAGLSAARRARKNDPNLQITVLEQSSIISYGACGLPYYIGDVIKQKEKLLVLPVERLLEDQIDVRLNHRLVEIDRRQRAVLYQKAGETAVQRLPYDRLIIATGASPLVPDIPGVELEGVYTVRSLTLAERLKRELQSGKHQSAVVIGAGYIGLEMAEALSHYGLQVTVIEQQGQVLPYIDSDMAALVERNLVQRGVRVKLASRVVRIEGQQAVSGVQTEAGEIIRCTLVIVAIGVKPNVEFARKAGLELGAGGALRVDDQMRTNVFNIFAAGDCAVVKNLVTNKYEYIPLGTTANKQGRVAGDNASGKRTKFAGVVATAAVQVFDQEIGRTGITENYARKLKMPVKAVTIKSRSRAGYFPNGAELHLKLIFNFLNGRILGAQIIGGEGVAKRLDVLATALQQKLTVQQLSALDLSYAPPFAPVWDPILIAANQALKLVKQTGF